MNDIKKRTDRLDIAMETIMLSIFKVAKQVGVAKTIEVEFIPTEDEFVETHEKGKLQWKPF
jgi:hypothetical protein